MSRALFVSDIHIASPDDERAELFRRFLLKCQQLQPEHLFLVGDIFDLWVADRSFFISAYQPLIDELSKLKKLGTEIHYFEGNHDLDLRPYWQHKLGFDVQDSAAFYALNGQSLRVEHGDQMDPEDTGYLFLRWLLRTKILRLMGRILPDALVGWIGRRASHASRGYTTQVKVASDGEVRGKIKRHAERVFQEKPFDLLISGHVHVRNDEVLVLQGKKIRSVNLGTWLKEPLVFDFNETDARLVPVEAFILS